jgi:hypothetical protein
VAWVSMRWGTTGCNGRLGRCGDRRGRGLEERGLWAGLTRFLPLIMNSRRA